MKTHVLRMLAGLMALAVPALALAADPAPADKPAAAAPAEKPAAPPTLVAGVDSEQSPNQLLHTVQRKEFPDGRTNEVVLYPAVLQMNSKFTNHFGSAIQYAYHLHENFALQVQGDYFWTNAMTSFTDELISKGHQAPQAATALTLQWAATGGFEVTPVYGKFAFFDDTIGHFGLVLSGGIGLGGSRIQIKGNSSDGGATFGDTGTKLVGEVGAGFRVRLNEHFLVRVEMKDLLYTAKVDSINGCSGADLDAMKHATFAQIGSAQVSGTCNKNAFTGGDGDYSIASELVKSPSSDVLNNLGFYGGVSYSF